MTETCTGIIRGDGLDSGDQPLADLGPGFGALDVSAMIIDEFAEFQDDLAEADDDMVIDTGYGSMRLQDMILDTTCVDAIEH